MANQQEMVTAVKAHALENYENGWDTVVECWETQDIICAIGAARTTAGAIKKVKAIVGTCNAFAADIEATEF